jgi:hypothetical protein
MAEVDPAADAEGMVRDFQSDPGRTLHGKVLDPEGRPLAGANCRGLSPHSGAWLLLGSEDFMVRQYRPDAPRVVQFYHKERKLAGWQVVQGSQQSPITVRLQPWGVLTGRIVDTQGKPMAKILLKGGDGGNRNDPAIADLLPELYSFTDENGGFRIEGLAPGMKYNVVAEAGGNVVSNLSVAPGETKDLGEVRLAAVTSRVKELQERVMKMEQEALQRARAKKKAKD